MNVQPRGFRGWVRWSAATAVLAAFFSLSVEAKEKTAKVPAQEEWSCASEPNAATVTARTLVEMTEIERDSDRNYISKSPDGSFFAFVTRCGDLSTNSNKFTIWIYQRKSIRDSLNDPAKGTPTPAFRLVRRSMDDEPSISDLRWSYNSRRLFFRSRQKGLQRIEVFNVISAKASLVAEEANILTYDVTQHSVVYAAIEGSPSREHLNYAPEGYLQTTAHLGSVLGLVPPGRGHMGFVNIFERRLDNGRKRHVAHIERKIYYDPAVGIAVSPDGRYAVMALPPTGGQPSWMNYQPPTVFLESLLKAAAKAPDPDLVNQFYLIDLQSGKMEPILDAPVAGVVGYGFNLERAVWATDSRSAVLLATMLPLDASGGDDAEIRRRQPYAVHFDARSLRWTAITPLPRMGLPDGEIAPVIAVDPATKRLTIQHRARKAGVTSDLHLETYVQAGGGSWQASSAIRAEPAELTLQAERSLNEPPEVSATDSATGKTIRITNLNPSLRRLDVGKVEVIEWKDRRGRIFEGGLLYPPGYVPGRPLPLVIQTYGFSRNYFRLHGLTAPFAARALAGRDMIVLQVPIMYDLLGTPDEGPAHLDMLQGAIDALVGKGLVDRKRVGLVGFSATCYQVKYAIAAAPDVFKAAVASDGHDVGYYLYLLNKEESSLRTVYESMYGGSPLRVGLTKVAEIAPQFKADRVKAALLTQAIGKWSILGQWEMHAALRSLGAPADMLIIPTGKHDLEMPAERLQSTQATVDWMSFWLADREDLSVGPQTLKHWRAMREQQRTRLAAGIKR